MVSTRVCEVGLERFVRAWNSHHLPLRGIPNLLQAHGNGTAHIHPAEIPTVMEAAAGYRQQGGQLTDLQVYGNDPLDDGNQQREELFAERVGNDYSVIS